LEVSETKQTVLALFLCCVLLLSSCADVRTDVEGMLTAPTLTEDQYAVKEALEAYTGEPPRLKYPKSGDRERRAPIQFIDLDGDGINEAVVFCVTGESDVAQLAVLVQADESWTVAGITNGLDINIESVNFLTISESGSRYILAEWSSANPRERKTSVYRFDRFEEDEPIIMGFDDTSSRTLVYDLNGDGYPELIYVAERAGRFTLKYVNLADMQQTSLSDDEGETIEPDVDGHALDERMIGCLGLTAGTLADGTRAIFIDESIGIRDDGEIGYQVTEVFILEGDHLKRALDKEDYDITILTERPDTDPTCRNLFDDENVVFPSTSGPEALEPIWLYWYSINEGEVECRAVSYADANRNFALLVPDYWISKVTVDIYNNNDENPCIWVVSDVATQTVFLTIKMLSVGESSAADIENGFQLVGQAGSYRYYIKGNLNEDGLKFILL